MPASDGAMDAPDPLLQDWLSGNSVEPGAAYAAFRGRPATVQPLLVKKGLVPVRADA